MLTVLWCYLASLSWAHSAMWFKMADGWSGAHRWNGLEHGARPGSIVCFSEPCFHACGLVLLAISSDATLVRISWVSGAFPPFLSCLAVLIVIGRPWVM